MKDDHIIVGVHITNRVEKAGSVQGILTEYGCNIKTRLGLHTVTEDACSPAGLLILEMVGDEAKVEEMIQKINDLTGVDAKKMIFGH
jgi:hypothetical protein